MEVTALFHSREIRDTYFEILNEALLALESDSNTDVNLLIRNWRFNPNTPMVARSGSITIGSLIQGIHQGGGKVKVELSSHALKVPNVLAIANLRSLGVPASFSNSRVFGSSHEKIVALSVGDVHFLVVGSADFTKARLHRDPIHSSEFSLLFKVVSKSRPQSVEEYFELFTTDKVQFYRVDPSHKKSRHQARKVMVDFLESAKGNIFIEDQYGIITSTRLRQTYRDAINRGVNVHLRIPSKGKLSHLFANMRARSISMNGLTIDRSLSPEGGTAFTHRKLAIAPFAGILLTGSSNQTRRSLAGRDGEVICRVNDGPFVRKVFYRVQGKASEGVNFGLKSGITASL
jgi:phosphatidylserine/phosphatidylglycerophosphate/cardiolipin synthase-like enzyme